MREIKESESFGAAVTALGGYRAIDKAMEAIVEGLYRNPFGFDSHQNDWCSFRYARTKRIDSIPPLIVIFTIEENGDVVLQHVEEDDNPYIE
ncbi:hypothetical protein A7A08_01281 [Methyloligella halotolerans]|uniref:Plasmid stabilization system protein n=1 Tax=Methyloligella halotolerans TaxID=1177755 RepID=A0A1E2S0X3_9HYPH|nr:hypothetical protein [Methyloligella halotolerans]ODA68111.1 hypothetical protein A7A08_01281 [Methyloligella halotolerans]